MEKFNMYTLSINGVDRAIAIASNLVNAVEIFRSQHYVLDGACSVRMVGLPVEGLFYNINGVGIGKNDS
jgi:hypothetical protein